MFLAEIVSSEKNEKSFVVVCCCFEADSQLDLFNGWLARFRNQWSLYRVLRARGLMYWALLERALFCVLEGSCVVCGLLVQL